MTTKPRKAEEKVPADRQALEPVSMRLWVIVLPVTFLLTLIIPWAWNRFEKIPGPANARLPYHLSKDYWLYNQSLRQIHKQNQARPVVDVLGDSVVWGEFVDRDATLSAYLNEEARRAGDDSLFVNAGINGLYPLALEGLANAYLPVRDHGKVLLHANLLWMSSPEADLQTSKEQTINHAALLPQFTYSVKPYKADFEARASVLWTRHIPFASWSDHLRIAYFNNKSLQDWTTFPGDAWPPDYPNASRSPISQLRESRSLQELAQDPDRGPASDRHRPWHDKGMSVTSMNWVSTDDSVQYSAFQRLVRLLQSRNADVLIVIGPLNRHMMDEASVSRLLEIEKELEDWLKSQGVPSIRPEPLPSDQYADTSHPLTDGYQNLAESVFQNSLFQSWLSSHSLADF